MKKLIMSLDSMEYDEVELEHFQEQWFESLELFAGMWGM